MRMVSRSGTVHCTAQLLCYPPSHDSTSRNSPLRMRGWKSTRVCTCQMRRLRAASAGQPTGRRRAPSTRFESSSGLQNRTHRHGRTPLAALARLLQDRHRRPTPSERTLSTPRPMKRPAAGHALSWQSWCSQPLCCSCGNEPKGSHRTLCQCPQPTWLSKHSQLSTLVCVKNFMYMKDSRSKTFSWEPVVVAACPGSTAGAAERRPRPR